MTRVLVVSNNPSLCGSVEPVLSVDGGVIEVLQTVRNMVHLGHRLLTHPFAGSVKPNENPYKSVVVTKERFGVDYQSIQIIEGCLQVAERMLRERSYRNYPASVLEDLALIDKTLLMTGLESL
jgi:hypothetical protein